MITQKDFKIVDVDTGFCRIVYRTQNKAGQFLYYCLQDEGEKYGGVKFYRCTDDDYAEPSHEVRFKPEIEMSDKLEIPQGDSELERRCREFLGIL